MFSILINYIISLNYIHKNRIFFLYFIILFNLIFLLFFKYFNFFVTNTNYVFSTKFQTIDILIPLGISFYTFQQISYQVDCYKEKILEKNKSFIKYIFYVSFFPQLVAGPILRYNDIINQINTNTVFKLNFKNLAIGFAIIILALAKKILIADELGQIFLNNYNNYLNTGSISFVQSWIMIFSFSLQIYFDFSAYSEIAFGICKILNLQIPGNFNSPYKATSMIDFWRRWHITLSSFFRDYLYIPLGGNKNGIKFKISNIIFVMSLVGFWHGASWNFLAWGFANGFLISLNHLIKDTKFGINFFARVPILLKRLIIFTIVSLLFLFFRVIEFDQSIQIFSAAFDFKNYIFEFYNYNFKIKDIFILIFSLIIVLFFPNIFEVFEIKPYNFQKMEKTNLYFSSNYLWLFFLIFLILILGFKIGSDIEFIYFQF